jgi:uracil-DNA glycosylase family 4
MKYNDDGMPQPHWLQALNDDVVKCTRCLRLVKERQRIAREKRPKYRDCEYWGKPVPGFGDPNARVLVLGLAPGAHGANRTGRPFTGDACCDFMYPVLRETEFALLDTSTAREDGQVLTGLYITNAARCAPPHNKPKSEELANCSPFLGRELEGLKDLRVVVALGGVAFEAYLNYLMRRKAIASKREYKFGHGAEYSLPDGRTLLASFHPSPINTRKGKLTTEKFQEIFKRARELADESTGRIPW